MSFESSRSHACNPMIKPLLTYHNELMKTFKPLPKNNKVLELSKRIGLVAVSIFAYPILGIIALVGLPFTSCFEAPSLKIRPRFNLATDLKKFDNLVNRNIRALDRAIENLDRGLNEF